MDLAGYCRESRSNNALIANVNPVVFELKLTILFV